ncbi:hypothetical protein D3C87_592610 [compost metagenome]
MKKTFRKLRQVDKSLRKCKKELQNIQELPFYTLFKQETQRSTDEETLNITIQELARKKAQLLEKLKQKIVATQHSIAKQAA